MIATLLVLNIVLSLAILAMMIRYVNLNEREWTQCWDRIKGLKQRIGNVKHIVDNNTRGIDAAKRQLMDGIAANKKRVKEMGAKVRAIQTVAHNANRIASKTAIKATGVFAEAPFEEES